MKREVSDKIKKREEGYALLAVILFVGITALIVAGTLERTATSSQSVVAQKSRTSTFLESEETFNVAANWLRAHSRHTTSAFSRENFYNNFERTVPQYGLNDSGIDNVPVKVLIRDTGNAALLASGKLGGASAFPLTKHLKTGENFNAAESFASQAKGLSAVRITLIDVIPDDPTKDFGDPALGNPPPQTDFSPVYRIDSMTSGTDGSHVYGYLLGQVKHVDGVGFYGEDFLDLRQSCDSYKSDEGPYSQASKNANCVVGSAGNVNIHQSELVYGSARTAAGVSTNSPWGGSVCADFESGCPSPGEICEGQDCDLPSFPEYENWGTYCPTHQGNVNVSGTMTLTSGAASSQSCWNTVKTSANSTLRLTTTAHPYYFDTLDLHNNSHISFEPDVAGGTIEIYVRSFDKNNFNASQKVNTSNRPSQLKIHYLGFNDITINGNADMYAFVTSPNAGVTVSGNSSFHGGIMAKNLTVTGNGKLRYDESGGKKMLSDMKHEIKSISQHYR